MRRGTQNSVNFAGKCMSIIIVWCMVLSGFMGLFLVNVGTASEINPNTIKEDLVVDSGDFVIESFPWDPQGSWIYDLDGSVTVTGANSLILKNSTLNILQLGAYSLDVSAGGTIKMTNSTITTDSLEFLNASFITGSNLIMDDNSALLFPGNLTFDTSSVNIKDSQIINPVIYFDTCTDVTIADSKIVVPGNANGSFYLDSTEMSIINTDINFDYTLDNNTNCQMNLTAGSYLYAYNMTVGDLTEPIFIFADAVSEVYYYKWAEFSVVDSNNNPIFGAGLSCDYHHTDAAAITYVDNMNNLALAPHTNADDRMIDYLNRISPDTITSANYDVTNSDGMALIPLFTTLHSQAEQAIDVDGHHYGEYNVDVTYSAETGYTYVDFSPYPEIKLINNTVEAPPVQMTGVTLTRPDLTLVPGDITFNPAMDIMIGDSVEINVTINNEEITNALDVFVQIFDYDDLSGIPTEIYNTTIASVPGNDDVYFLIDYIFLVGGLHDIMVVIDYNNTVIEENEMNNSAIASIYVTPDLPELSIETANIGFSQENVSFDNEITITARVRNNGTLNGTNVFVSFFDSDPDMNGDGIVDNNDDEHFTVIGTTNIPNIMPGELITTSVNWIPEIDGTYTIYVWADPSNSFTEYYEDNNLASRDIIITPKPNPTITNFAFDDDTPITGQTVELSLDLINIGNINATGNITVEFYDYDMYGNPLGLIGTAHMKRDLNMTETHVILQDWTPVNIDYHMIQVIVTSDNDVDEGDLTDNVFYFDILVYDDGFQDLIVNNTLPLYSPMDLEIIGDYGLDGYALVEENGVLTIDSSTFTVKQDFSFQFNMIVKDNAVLNILDTSFLTAGSFMELNIMDNAVVNIVGSNLPTTLNIIADDSSTVNIIGSVIGGIFSAPASDADVTLYVENSTFYKPMNNFGGTSTAQLVALTMAIPSILAQESAKIEIYRWLDVQILDANGYPLPGADVDLHYQVGDIFQDTQTTDMDGKVLFMALSDTIVYSVHPSAASTSNYRLTSSFLTYQDHINITLPYYPVMTLASNYIVKDANGVDLLITMDGVRPDLDPPIYVSPSELGRNEILEISTVINNLGNVTAHDIVVRFYDETFDEIIAEVPMEPLAVGESRSVNITHSWSSEMYLGVHNISVTVDWGNLVKELDETNNHAYTNVTVVGRADLTIGDYGISIVQESVVNHPISIGVIVDNIGDINTADVTVSAYYDDDVDGTYSNLTGRNMTFIGETTIALIMQGSSASIEPIVWVPDMIQTYNITIIVDEGLAITEVDEDNNIGTDSITVNDYSDIYVGQVLFIVDGQAVTEVNNRTLVTIRALVNNTGGTANTGIARFYDHYDNEIGNYILPVIGTGPDDGVIVDMDWFPMEDMNGNSVTRNVEVRVTDIGMGENMGGQSNTLTESITINDPRADLTAAVDDLNVITADIFVSSGFDVNITVYNNGDDPAQNFTIEVFYDDIMDGNRIGSMIVQTLAGDANVSVDMTCMGIPTDGEHFLLVSIDRDVTDDNFTANGINYNITGNVEEFNEMNNDLINVTIDVSIPEYIITLDSPSPDISYELGSDINNTFVSGRLATATDDVGVPGVTITITLGTNTVTTETDNYGSFGISIPLPTVVGQYQVTASADNSEDTTTQINMDAEPEDPILFYIIIIIIVIVAVIVGITLFYFKGLGKTVECGECGAFIPESASKCPKCNVEFETDTAKCSVCGAWVEMNSKTCPECSSEFTIGDEEIDDYKAQMKKQYNEVVNGFRTEAKKELGSSFSEEDFQAWWATQATFITFDQWLKEDEEMKRLGSKPCPNCATPNSVTATICHKCGTVMDEEKKKAAPAVAAAPVAVKKKAEPEVAKPEAKPTPAAEPAKAAEEAPAEEKPAEEPAGDEKKKCPSCGMELGAHEKSCPICAYEFDKGDEKPPETGGSPPEGGAAPTKKVVRKPVKKVVRRPVQKTGGGE